MLFFANERQLFEDTAHYAAAIAMFVCIIAVVVLNAVGFGRDEQARRQAVGNRAYVNRYLAVAVAMAAGVVAMLLWDLVAGWEHLVFGLEALLIGLFAVFWLVQTSELWRRGLRGDGARAAGVTAAPPS